MSAAVEMHYTAVEVGLLIRKSVRYVKDKAKAGAFGAVFFVDGDYIIPASGVNAFLQAHPIPAFGVRARSKGEFIRKQRQQAEQSTEAAA